jgi:YHS domain-containing protein
LTKIGTVEILIKQEISVTPITEVYMKVIDPVCKMEIEDSTAIKESYNGKTYYFCCEHCKEKFKQEPEKYLKKK